MPSPPVFHKTSAKSFQRYQWGFSFVQLFIMNILLLLWALSMLIMWYHAQAKLFKGGYLNIGGGYKAVVDVAEAMHKELDTPDFSLRQSTETQIKQRTVAISGGSISSDPLRVIETAPDNSFGEWLAHERWWWPITYILFACGSTILGLFYIHTDFSLIGPTCGLIFALAVGSTTKSRLVFVLLGMLSIHKLQ
ncbi:hypothetical protein DM02DRAFT_215056 [Periconia macrospinosa]|uniref:Uncharacterized protein n=1 Tax=Periconia macrospinosa TaxID=97972 RepID=A0A2V1D6J0_9PLEO|nr:hypothetical protein DM02DRAFT_215056 [Periconia macrospinosa]